MHHNIGSVVISERDTSQGKILLVESQVPYNIKDTLVYKNSFYQIIQVSETESGKDLIVIEHFDY